MRADRVIIEPFAYDSIGELEIEKEIGSHATARVSGILEKGADGSLLERISPDETVTIKAVSMAGEETVLFRGLIETVSLKTEAGLKILRFTAISHTCLLDRKRRVRVFQDREASFRDIAKYIGEENGATVYSSPDGTGWYCMPEKGDAVRVYFQDFDERKAVAFNSIHLACGLREDPEIQYIRSPHDKEIRFEPSAIRITNHQGISVVLDDKKGITLESASDIVAIAGGDIDIQSQRELNVTGDKGIMIQQGDNRIEVKDGIRQVAREIWQR